jgi:hypothetical protein
VRFRPKSLQLWVDSVYTLVVRQRSLKQLSRGQIKLDLLVCSPGGVATSALMNHLQKYLLVNSPGDSDGLKHLATPSKVTNVPKILYLTGELQPAIASLRRRGYLLPHVVKLGGWKSIPFTFFPKLWEARVKKLMSKQLAEFSRISQPSCLVIPYELIWDKTEEIATFVGLDRSDFSSTFPPKRVRATQRSQGDASE